MWTTQILFQIVTSVTMIKEQSSVALSDYNNFGTLTVTFVFSNKTQIFIPKKKSFCPKVSKNKWNQLNFRQLV